MKLRVISREEVKSAVSMAQAIETVKSAFAQLSTGHARVPIRTQLGIPLHDGVTLFMPAYLENTDELGMKMVSVFSGNVEQGLPIINALVILVDPETGLPTAIIDGTYLTALRTGAGSGAATEPSGAARRPYRRHPRNGGPGADPAPGGLHGAPHGARSGFRYPPGRRGTVPRRDDERGRTHPRAD